MQEWKKWEQIAGVENAGVSRMERQPEIIFETALNYFVILVLIHLTE